MEPVDIEVNVSVNGIIKEEALQPLPEVVVIITEDASPINE